MNVDKRRLELDEMTEKVIGCALVVSNTLGCGFLEKVFENALAQEFRKRDIRFSQQHSIQIRYDGVIVGDYVADFLVEENVLVELKAVKDLDEVHVALCLNYLKATGHSVCLLLNFGKPKVTVKRVVRDF